MMEKWTGGVVAKLHMHGITRNELAAELGITPQYVSMLLNGKKTSPGMEPRMMAAIEAIVERRSM